MQKAVKLAVVFSVLLIATWSFASAATPAAQASSHGFRFITAQLNAIGPVAESTFMTFFGILCVLTGSAARHRFEKNKR